MKDPQKELDRLSKNPVHAKDGSVFVNTMFKDRPSIQLDLKPYPGRSQGSFHLFSPPEWVRAIEVMRAYFKQEK